MSDNAALLKALMELTNQVARVAAATEANVKMCMSSDEGEHYRTCRCCGFTLLHDAADFCPACRERNSSNG